nr:penicillin-binding protein 1A [Algicola sagamiensis]
MAAIYFSVRSELPSVETLKDVKLQTPMRIFSQDGQLISQFGEKRRIPLSIDEIPEQLKQAILATEDARFYEHPGVDAIGVVRAAVSLIVTGKKKQGASTITMQLARNFFLTREKKYSRKIKEIFIALHIEKLLTKDEILALYLNKIELGNRAFGVGAAAQVYYGKDISQLNLAQLAMIAGLPKAPSSLNPIRHPERARKRRSVVLGRMLTVGYISQNEYREANEQPVTARYHGANITAPAPYIAEMAHSKMLEMFGDDIYTNGYKVYTTTPWVLQEQAIQALRENLHAYDERHGYRGALANILEAKTSLPEAPENDSVETIRLADRLDDEAIKESFQKYPARADGLFYAVVTELEEQSAVIRLKDGSHHILHWEGMRWARPFIDDNRQGKAPKSSHEILALGDIILVRQNNDKEWRLSQYPDASSALIALDPQTGAIRSAVGGYSFYQSQFNRATQAKRQIGSNIKPYIYSAALDHGFTLASLVNDAPITKWDRTQGTAWRPKNSPPVYDGPTRVRVALAKSKNVVSVRLLRAIGLDTVIERLVDFGFDPSDIPQNETIALGSSSFTPLEVATSMSAFANGGYLVSPFLIERVEDSDGNIIYEANPDIACSFCLDERYSNEDRDDAIVFRPEAKRIISKQNAFLVANAMTSSVSGGGSWRLKTGWNGTAWRARSLKRNDLSGKTGTTNDMKDTWFTGFNHDLLTTVWVGFDNPSRSLGMTSRIRGAEKGQVFGREAGAIAALPGWIRYNREALKNLPSTPVSMPEDIVTIRVDQGTGLLSRKSDDTTRFEYFKVGTEPTEFAEEKSENINFDLEESDETMEDLFQ